MNNIFCKKSFFRNVLFSFLFCLGFVNIDTQASVFSLETVNFVKEILQKESSRIIDLSNPMIFLYRLLSVYQIYPEFLLSMNEKILCSLLMGIYIGCKKYLLTKTRANCSGYIPSFDYRAELEKIVIDCKMDPKLISFCYILLNRGMVTSNLNTIQINPVLCYKFNRDPVAIRLTQRFGTDGIRGQEKINERLHSIFNSNAQDFALKYELSHVFSNYSYKELVLIVMAVAITVYVGLEVTFHYAERFNIFSILVGMVAAGLTDLMLDLCLNVFKFIQEKNADFFAVTFSSLREIESAAIFFMNYDEVVYGSQQPTGRSQFLNMILNGRCDLQVRAKRLRDFAESKKN